MSDSLVSLGKNAAARRLVGMVGVSLPPPLERDTGPWRERELEDREILVLADRAATLGPVVARCLGEAGATAVVVGAQSAFVEAGQAWGRPPREAEPEARVHGVVLDVSGLATVEDLDQLYTLLQPWVRGLRSSGRVVVLSRPVEDGATVEQQVARRAIDGFMRSVAKEVGRKGATCNQLIVETGAEDRLPALLRWALSPRSAYVSGQPLTVSAAVTTVTPAVAPRWARPLDTKVALVTGAAQGIGAATARALAREGARVVVLDRPGDQEKANEVAREVDGVPLLVDLSEDDAPATVAAFLRERFGGVDVVIHNAGVTRDKTLGNMDRARWDLTLKVNTVAVLRLHAALLPLLRPAARVVCLSSIAGLAGNVGQTNYALSKAAIAGFVAAAAPALAARGIALNAVAPGFIETRMTAAIPLATREVARRLSNVSQGGLPEDVAETLCFLSTPGACALSGQVLRVCGGNLVGR